jgi:hypothetical protein
MKKKAKTPSMTPAEQSARFKETARKLGADERPEEFDEAFKRVTSSASNHRQGPRDKKK